jgi:hypothetical protein
MIKFYV